ncbi:MAG: DinB family protein, partial [Cytophagales bacterium]|nr:DinB family protein [Cytophagales bacterium]
MNSYFLKLYRYNHWANIEICKAIEPVYSSSPYIAETFSHVVNAQYIWTGRIDLAKKTPFRVREIQDYSKLTANIEHITKDWLLYLQDITPEELARVITYTNSFGESFTSVIQDVIAHLVNHSSYHRGQVAKELRNLGIAPPNTDYIT